MNNVSMFPTGSARHLFTHIDLDGLGCAVLVKKAYPDTTVHFINYDTVNEEVMALAINDPTASFIITDMSVSEEVAEYLHEHASVQLIDHHPTAKPLERFPWAFVDTTESATYWTYQILSRTHHLEDYEPLMQIVNDYDTWGHNTYPQEAGHVWSRLNYLLGQERLLHRFILSPATSISPVEEAILAIDKEQEAKYIADSIEKAAPVQDGLGNTYMLVAADRYLNTVGHALLEHYPQVEYVMMIDFRQDKASLRGRGNLHLGDLAKQVGGGGHKKAAGFPLNQAAVTMFTGR